MAKLSCLVAAVIGIVSLASSIAIEPTGRAPNPCDVLNVEQNWLSPNEVRDCFASVPLTLRIRDGVGSFFILLYFFLSSPCRCLKS